MANAFDQANYPSVEPESFVIGDRWTWRKSLSDYPVATYTLSYEAVGHSTKPSLISITATNDGTDHIVEVATTDTAQLEPGTYSWSAFITRNSDSERVRVSHGTWEVCADPTESADPRSVAKRALDDCEAILAARSGRADANYSVGDRSLTFLPDQELRDRRDYWRTEYEREVQLERVASGRSTGTTVGVRF